MIIVQRKKAVAGVGALPAYDSTGNLLQSGTLAGTYDVDVPAHASGDLLLLVVGMRNATAPPDDPVLSSINTAGWTQLGGAGNTYGASTRARLGIGWKIGNGVETTVNITTTGDTTVDALLAHVHRFTCATAFAATPLQNIAETNSDTSPVDMPMVAVPGANCLAVAIGMAAHAGTYSEPTGETGGDWGIQIQRAGSAYGMIVTLISDQSGGGTITGGTMASTANQHCVVGAAMVSSA